MCSARAGSHRAEKKHFKAPYKYIVDWGCRRLQHTCMGGRSRSMEGIMMKLVERDSSSPASSRVHASLCIERSTRARSGEYSGVGRARSRARVPSCQRQLSYPQAQHEKHAFWHLHLQGDGATIAPWCSHRENIATMRPPPRFGEGPARLAAHLWLYAALAQGEERI